MKKNSDENIPSSGIELHGIKIEQDPMTTLLREISLSLLNIHKEISKVVTNEEQKEHLLKLIQQLINTQMEIELYNLSEVNQDINLNEVNNPMVKLKSIKEGINALDKKILELNSLLELTEDNLTVIDRSLL